MPPTPPIKTIALLVAAGKSERMGQGLEKPSLPKPYLTIGQETILRRTIQNFLSHPAIDGVRVVIAREHHPLYRKAIEGLTLFPCVMGGATRQESVRLGLESIAHCQPEWILVHDIARPLASHALISRVIDGLDKNEAVIPALSAIDTIKRIENGKIVETLPREQLVSVQTPQGFMYETLRSAHQKAVGKNLTDDAAVCEFSGVDVAVVEGETDNFKITTQGDLQRMQTILSLTHETRTGMGYDVHKLGAHSDETPLQQQTIKLCGVRIPFTHYLIGHSDADVGLHAMVDAILGAIGAGDIGIHFPPDDRKWQGADSERFLIHAYELLKNRGGDLVNIDVTLICERPKISEYREQMIAHIAQLLKIESDRISIKATTTEKLGFTGRAEGIAAQAVANVRLPR